MKKSAILIIFLISTANIAFSQDLDESPSPSYSRRTAVSLVPQSFFASGLEAAVETMIGPKGSLKFYGGYYTAEDHWLYNDAESMTGFKLELQPRLYINGDEKGLNGFFFGGSFNYRNTKLDDLETSNKAIIDVDARALGLGFVFGQQIIANSGFSFEWFIGGSLISPLSDYNADHVHISVINPYKRGIVPKVGISIGYAF